MTARSSLCCLSWFSYPLNNSKLSWYLTS